MSITLHTIPASRNYVIAMPRSSITPSSWPWGVELHTRGVAMDMVIELRRWGTAMPITAPVDRDRSTVIVRRITANLGVGNMP